MNKPIVRFIAMMFFVFIVVMNNAFVMAQDAGDLTSTDTTSGLKLLWTKTFKTPIDSVKIVGNGDKIAVALAPMCVKKNIATEKTLWHRGGNAEGQREICSDGHLEIYSRNGNFLWRYPSETKKERSFIGAYNVDASLDGKYFAASTSQRPCKMIDAILMLEDWQGDDPTWPVKVMSCNWAVDLIDDTGKQVWRKSSRSVAKFMPDNRHVLLLPHTWDTTNMVSYPEPPHSVSLIDMGGKEIWKEESKNIFSHYKPGYVAASPWFQFMSTDGHRFVIGNSLYELSGKMVKKLPFMGYGVGISRDGNYVLSCLHGMSLWDVATSTEVWTSDGLCEFTNLNEQSTIGDDDSFRHVQFNQSMIMGNNILWPKKGLSIHNIKSSSDSILIGGNEEGVRWIFAASGTTVIREEKAGAHGGMYLDSYDDWDHNLTGYRLPDGKLEWQLPGHDFFNLSGDGRLIAVYPSTKDSQKLEIYEKQTK